MGTDKKQEFTDAVRALCNHALDAKLKLQEFYSLWPEEADKDIFLRQVFEDIEDGVLHTPFFFLKRGVDYKSWYASDMYLTLYIDSILLSYSKSGEELLRCRKKVLDSDITNKEAIQEAIREYLKP